MMQETEPRLILYEYPFNERVRTLLRLEDLFDKLQYFCAQTHPYCHHTALLTLFEIVEVTSRADLKGEMLQELERHRQSLAGLRSNPQVAQEVLRALLEEIAGAQSLLNGTTGKVGQHLRDNEFLTSVRSRSIIPGGTCEFDLPAYHAWLARGEQSRADDLHAWIQPLTAFRSAMAMVLRLLREGAHHTQCTAKDGYFQQNLQGKTHALLQVRVARDLEAIPEVGANKYMLSIRFMRADRDIKPRPFEGDVDFALSLCAF